MIDPPAIAAPDAVVRRWKQAAAHALHAAGRADDPTLTATLIGVPREVRELVTHLAEALTQAAGVFLGSAANATPGARDALQEGLRTLVREIIAEQTGQTDGAKQYCPVPEKDGSGRLCTCGPDGRATCSSIAFDLGAGKIAHGAYPVSSNTILIADELTEPTTLQGDDGCEGGVR